MFKELFLKGSWSESRPFDIHSAIKHQILNPSVIRRYFARRNVQLARQLFKRFSANYCVNAASRIIQRWIGSKLFHSFITTTSHTSAGARLTPAKYCELALDDGLKDLVVWKWWFIPWLAPSFCKSSSSSAVIFISLLVLKIAKTTLDSESATMSGS